MTVFMRHDISKAGGWHAEQPKVERNPAFLFGTAAPAGTHNAPLYPGRLRTAGGKKGPELCVNAHIYLLDLLFFPLHEKTADPFR